MRHKLSELDHRLTARIQQWPRAFLPLMVACSFLGLPVITGFFGAAGVLWSYQQGNEHVSLVLLLSFAALGVSVFMKLVLRRERPETLYAANMRFKSYSFPSGHAFGSIVLYGLFAYLGFLFMSLSLAITLAVTLWVLIFLIGVSRVYLGAHFVFDVLGGWLLGGLMLLSLINIVQT